MNVSTAESLPANAGVADSVRNPIFVESIVRVVAKGSDLWNEQGLVMDTASNLHIPYGPIAVFFDRECKSHHFNDYCDSKWDEKPPTPANYKNHPRIKVFRPEELRVEKEFAMATLAKRTFGGENYNVLYTLNFPLIPNTHPCQLKNCRTGKLATHVTFMNAWGTVETCYTCRECHDEWNAARVDTVNLKNPLPGAPAR